MSWLKHYLTVMTSISIILGLVGVIIGAVQIHTGGDIWSASSYAWHQGTGSALIVFGVFMMIAGIFGLIGSLRKSKCFLLFYDICNVPLFISLLVIGIVAAAVSTVASDNLNDALSTNCQSITWISQADSLYATAAGNFCKNDCPCDLTNIQVIEANNQTQFDLILASGAPTRLQDCPKNVYNYTGEQINFANFFEYMENTYQCTGLCHHQNYYMFSNVNNGVPDKQGCMSDLVNFIHGWGKKIAIIAILAAIITFINAIVACCLCCRKKHDEHHEKGGIYERMTYYDE